MISELKNMIMKPRVLILLNCLMRTTGSIKRLTMTMIKTEYIGETVSPTSLNSCYTMISKLSEIK